MLSDSSISKWSSLARWLASALLLAVGHGHAQLIEPQPEPAARDPFGAYHSSLSKAADSALGLPVQPRVEVKRSDFALSSAPMTTSANVSVPAAAINRVQQLQPILEPILREERVPADLAAVVLVESGGQPAALSPKGARGIWQFMPDTARRYGLIVSRDRDERLDIQRSTRAAARYLRDLHEQFGDWQLAFAAYNTGGDRVQRAIERSHTSDFALLSSGQSLPLETRRYVPAVINAIVKIGNASGFVATSRGARVPWVLYAENKVATNQAESLKESKGKLK
jgi:soluble lytic murein transglycosylase-like protein